MPNNLTAIAQDLAGYDESALIELLGARAKMLETTPSIAGDYAPQVTYDAKFLGPLDDIKALGQRVLKRWNKDLFNIVCGSSKEDKKDRENILHAFTLGEAAAIAAMIQILVGLGLAPALAAVLAAIVVKRFLGSAIEVLCETWKTQVETT